MENNQEVSKIITKLVAAVEMGLYCIYTHPPQTNQSEVLDLGPSSSYNGSHERLGDENLYLLVPFTRLAAPIVLMG